MNSEPSAHAIPDHTDACPIHIAARDTVSPTTIDHTNKVGVGRFVLKLGAFVDVSFRRIAKHVIQIGNDRRIAELGESIRRCLQITRQSRMLMNHQNRRAFLVSIRSGDVAFDPVLLFF